jgi:hypothetical protein
MVLYETDGKKNMHKVSVLGIMGERYCMKQMARKTCIK